MPDIYLYDDVPVLKSRLGIKGSDLLAAVCSDPVSYEETSDNPSSSKAERYTKYQKDSYKPEPHYEKP